MAEDKKTFQVNHGVTRKELLTEAQAVEGLEAIVKTLSAETSGGEEHWADVTPYLSRAKKLDIDPTEDSNTKALLVHQPIGMAQFAQKIDAALQMAAALNRTTPATFDADVIYPPGDVVIIANTEGQKKLSVKACQDIIDKYRSTHVGALKTKLAPQPKKPITQAHPGDNNIKNER